MTRFTYSIIGDEKRLVMQETSDSEGNIIHSIDYPFEDISPTEQFTQYIDGYPLEIRNMMDGKETYKQVFEYDYKMRLVKTETSHGPDDEEIQIEITEYIDDQGLKITTTYINQEEINKTIVDESIPDTDIFEYYEYGVLIEKDIEIYRPDILVLTTESFNAEDVLLTTTVRKLDDHENVQSMHVVNSEGKLISLHQYTWEDNRTVKIAYKEDGIECYEETHEISYDELGNQVKITALNEKSEIVGYHEWAYDEEYRYIMEKGEKGNRAPFLINDIPFTHGLSYHLIHEYKD